MKRFVALVVVLALASAAFSALAQSTPVSAQINCTVFGGNPYNSASSPITQYFRLVSGSTVVGGPISVTIPPSSSVPAHVPLNGPFNGSVTLQASNVPSFSPLLYSFTVELR